MINYKKIRKDFEEDGWIKTPLPEGDIWIGNKNPIVIERKTWDDAYTSWMSKRVEDQIARIIENHDNSLNLL